MTQRIVTLTNHKDAKEIEILREAEKCSQLFEPFKHDGKLWLIHSIDIEAGYHGVNVTIDGVAIK